MKQIIIIPMAVMLILTACFNKSTSRPNTMENTGNGEFYNFKMTSIDGELIDFSKYKGKKIMIVNVASKCGYTPQYADLQELYEAKGDDLVILGFPANNFGGQEPGSNEEIATFCQKNYGVEFQMFEKISVKGEDMHPLYKWLSTSELNGWNDEAPNWNFCKYIIDENGNLTHFFQSGKKPMSEEVLSAIQ